jgi:hypothetical protein
MKQNLILLLLILTFSISQAQLKKVVLLEEATNASCGPCAANNPKLQKFYSDNYGYVISVRYHAWWPGTDPMYSANTTENRDRIQYYSISGVPTYVLDGQVYGVPSSPDIMENQLKGKLAQSSPFRLTVTASINGSQLTCDVVVKAVENTAGSTFYLRNAIVEREIHYSIPPGSNGEKDFYCVFRKFLNNSTGELLPAMNAGDTKTFHYTYTLNPAWQKDRIQVVSWIQNDANKQVVQASASSQLYQIESAENSDFIILHNETTAIKKFFVVNYNSAALNLKFSISPFLASTNFSAKFQSATGNVTSYTTTIQPGDTGWISVEIEAPQRGGMGFRIVAENLNDSLHYTPGKKVYVMKLPASVLLIDADGDYNFEDIFKNAMDQQGISYVPVKHGDLYAFSQEYNLNNFPVIIMNNGWGFPAFLSTDISILQNYLNNGGNLFIHGQDIGWDVSDANGSSSFARTFYSNYLKARYVKDQATSNQVNGVTNDPISNGISFTLNQTVHSYYPDVISTNGTGATPIFTYGSGTEIAGIKVDNGTYKLVYLAFGLEQVSSPAIQSQIITNAFNWFGNLNEISDHKMTLSKDFRLYQNYPNPFNPETVIPFSLSKPADVEIVIFDITGRKIRSFAKKFYHAGFYQIQWDGTSDQGITAPSGIYIYQLKVGNHSESRKMILIK